jgi:lysophospholipase L1-like esterase
LGDSITHNGQWIAEVFEYFRENFRELEIGLYNCGVAGTSAWTALLKDRLYCDCLNLFPKYTVIMFGMNDIGRFLFGKEDEESRNARIRRMKLFEKSMRTIIAECKAAGTIPILCSPTPYDEYNDSTPEFCIGIEHALMKCTEIVQSLAYEEQLLYIDMHAALMEYMDQRPIGQDRVHPSKFGHHLMAENFLCGIGAKNVMEPEKEVVLHEKNQVRYEAEQLLRRIVWVERDLMGWHHLEEDLTLEERKEQARKRLETEKGEGACAALQLYLENADFKEKLRGDVVRKTVEMYN